MKVCDPISLTLPSHLPHTVSHLLHTPLTRPHTFSLSELGGSDLTPMSLGLSHSLSRYKLKFSPDKVDTMIVQVRWNTCFG